MLAFLGLGLALNNAWGVAVPQDLLVFSRLFLPFGRGVYSNFLDGNLMTPG